jgi:hypothetical protein
MQRGILVLALCAGLRAQSGIDGVVVDGVTKHPLAGVHITLHELNSGSSQPGPPYGALSGKDGHFSIGNMKPGVYILVPQFPGYVRVPDKDASRGGGLSIALKAGEPVRSLMLEMTPKAFISGRVTDENGDPVQRAQLLATPVPGGGPGRIAGQTDERGRYRIGGAPGKYLVQATAGLQNQQPEIRNDGTQPVAYAVTWYPGTANKASAGIVETLPRRENTGIDIRLVQTRSFSIQGSVSGIPAGGHGFIMLWQGDDVQQFGRNIRTAGVADDGKFVIAALAPGRYTAVARFDMPPNPMRSFFEPVLLESADTTGVNLRLVPGEEMAGTVEYSGDLKDIKLIVRLEPVLPVERMFGNSAGGETLPDGSFRIQRVFPGKYRVKVSPLPEGSYVKSVRLDGADNPDLTLDLTRGTGGGRMKIIMGANAGTVQGTVLDAAGKPSQSPLTLVVLARSSDDIGQEDMKRLEAGVPYVFSNLRPGKYRLFATNFMGANTSDEMKVAFGKAEEIEIKEGAKITKDIVIGKDASHDR